MNERLWSPAVQRVVERARAGTGEISPRMLWQSLLEEEGRARELLRTLDLDWDGLDALLASSRVSSTAILHSAAGMCTSADEMTSLHLLAAFMERDADLAAWLEEAGLTADRLAAEWGEPVDAAPLSTAIRIAPDAAPVDDRHSVLRILDAASNRAREGLRVLEDHARFALDDALLTRRLKELRHRLAQASHRLVGDAGIRSRDTPHDVGTEIHTFTETHRSSAADILRANAKRVQEALRTLEEYGKRIAPVWSQELEQIRYAAYTLEQALLAASGARERLSGAELCLLATDAACLSGIELTVRGALRGGCGMIQLREKGLPDQQLLAQARMLRSLTREAGALLIINDRPDIAVLCDADGVHVGQDDLAPGEARRIVGGDRLVGVSTHSLDQIEQAVLAGADYVGVGPVFPSSTKQFDALAGLEFVRQAAESTSLPCYAIGGIDGANLEQVLAAGGTRVAVSSAICGAADPAAATRDLMRQLRPDAESKTSESA